MISKKEAIEIAKEHHGDNFEFFDITHGLPSNCRIYNPGPWYPDDVWCVFCSSHPGKCMIASSRVIIISKGEGFILYDGSACDEG